MKVRHLPRALAASVLGLGGATALALPAQASPSLNYVAMGDSYSAASGVVPLAPSADPLCARSTLNYPHLIASKIGATLTDVTCGGAKTGDFTSSQYPGVAPQLNALGSATRLVTMTIGGNDGNLFASTVLACGTAGVSTGGLGHPCQTLYGSSFVNTVNTTIAPALKNALQQVRAKAPNARVAILGYPRILPDQPDPSCFAKMPIAMGDYAYVNNIEAALNSAVQQAAAQTGSTYVTMAASVGHDACQPLGTRWVEPALFGTNFVPVHPNALGESMMGQQAMQQLGLGLG
ncbi:SGNH/GDSL hydrolase family protein [Actinomadura rupiterrae]|uniref:SGNH/GDSL hydrolase family protein n=1 Tax=Actinomadura rupiterrae TaxID=559627 RepID=UPI0020A32E78|nr:SGNH/GDSL hydrolase family protein [Actinomadura rupiterrae]MCP2336173.1 lysophospholipase L1-like esterase [Actinomadura rupiterrae]